MDVRAQELFGVMQDSDGDGGASRIAPPAILGPAVLPFHELGDWRFERLAQWWAEAIDGNAVARMHGPSGRPDYGIDVLARQHSGLYWAYQCKCVKDFRPAQLRAAVEKFFAQKVANIDHFTILVACEGDDTALEGELNRLRVAHPGTAIEVLYQGNLSTTLQAHPSKVTATFGPEWTRAFCGIVHEGAPAERSRLGDCLPREATHFVGREAQLQHALEGLADRDADAMPGLIAVTGSPGVGKTALAIRFARSAANCFPDGQIFLAASPDGDPLDELLAIVGDGPSEPRDTRNIKIARLRSAVSARRMVVVLDDLRDEDTARDLVNAIGTAVTLVVTSRKKLSGLADIDPVFLDLDVLNPHDSTDLVRAIIGTSRLTPSQCDQLVEACGGLPLALRIAASRLARRQQLDVDAYLAEVAHPDRGLAALAAGDRSMAAIIDNTYHALTDGQRDVLHALGTLPRVVVATHAIAGAIAQSPAGFTMSLVQDVSNRLDSLFEASLVEQITADRFRLHDVLYRYARAKAAETTDDRWRSDAIANVCRVYEVLAQDQVERIGFLDAEATQPAPSNAEAIEVLDADLPTIRAIAESAQALGLWEQIVTLSRTYSAFLYHRGNIKDFIYFQQLVLLAGQRHDNSGWVVVASINIARAAHTCGDSDTALNMLRQAQDVATRSRDLVAFHQAATVYGHILMERGNNDEAINVLKATLATWRAVGDVDLLAQTLCNIGTAHLAAGRWTRAEAYLRNARDSGGGGLRLQRIITDHLNILLHRSGRGALAAAESQERANLSRNLGDRGGEAFALLQIAVAHSNTGDHMTAADCATSALRIFEEIGDATGRIAALLDLGKG